MSPPKALSGLRVESRPWGIEAGARVCYFAPDNVHVSSFKEVRP